MTAGQNRSPKFFTSKPAKNLQMARSVDPSHLGLYSGESEQKYLKARQTSPSPQFLVRGHSGGHHVHDSFMMFIMPYRTAELYDEGLCDVRCMRAELAVYCSGKWSWWRKDFNSFLVQD